MDLDQQAHDAREARAWRFSVGIVAGIEEWLMTRAPDGEDYISQALYELLSELQRVSHNEGVEVGKAQKDGEQE